LPETSLAMLFTASTASLGIVIVIFITCSKMFRCWDYMSEVYHSVPDT